MFSNSDRQTVASNPSIQAVVDWLNSQNLPPLPVAPRQNPREYPKVVKSNSSKQMWEHCPLDENLQPVPIFTGKNPSFLDRHGVPHLINHRQYQSRLPSGSDQRKWFANPDNGIGTLGGHGGVIWLDFDVKQFGSEVECSRAVNAWVESHPELKGTFCERTHSGGWRLGVKVRQKPDFTNFALSSSGHHVGEALGVGRFTVLAPTIGPSGNAYRSINRTHIVEVESLGAININPSGQSKKLSEPIQQPQPSLSVMPGSIPLEMLLTDQARAILNGDNPTGDRSLALTILIREAYGWENWANTNDVSIRDSAEILAHAAGAALSLDSERIGRILKTIDNGSSSPAAALRGDESSCWLKIRRLDKATFEAKCPSNIKDVIAGNRHQPRIHLDTIEEVKLRAEIVDVIGSHVELQKRGRDFFGLCPFHDEKTPSFSVSPTKQTYYCFGCNAGGNAIKFLMELGKYPFSDVVLDLARRYQVMARSVDSTPITLPTTPLSFGKRGSGTPSTEAVSLHERATLKKLSLEDAAERVKSVFVAKHTELTENIELEKIREAVGMSSYDWERKIIKPIKRELDAERFRFDLLNLLAVDDEVERIRLSALLAPKYQMSSGTIAQALQLIKERTSTPETQWYGLDEFFNLESEGLKWIIPELLPQGETIILAGAPKSGKTLLAIDAAFAVATGETFMKEAVTKGRVLIISVDESAHSTKAKLIKRGFRRSDTDSVQVMTKFDVRQMKALEERLEAFRPTLVIIDSLKRINHGQEISENSAEFADNIYTIKEMLTRYGAAGILIHHTSKNQDALGVGKLRGSSAIAGAVWGTWQLDHIPKVDPNNKKKLIIDPKDPRRILSVFARDTEGQQLRLELDLENNSWTNHGGVGDSEEWEIERKTLRVRITDVLTQNSHLPGLRGRVLIELMGMTPEEGRSVYSELNRMVIKRLLNCQPAPGDKRYNIYSLPGQSPPQDPENPPGSDGGGGSNPSSPPDFFHTPPSPPPSGAVAEYSAENQTPQGFPIVSKLVSNYSADSQQPVGDTPPADYSPPSLVGVSEILSNLNSEVGGGCVETESDPTLQPHQPTTPATAPADALAPQSAQQPTKEEWLSPESLEDMAGMLSICTTAEEIAELRKIWPDYALRSAGNLLDAESKERIKGLVLELNAQAISENPAQLGGFNNESLSKPTEQSQTQPPQNPAPAIELHTGMWVRCADDFYGHLGAQTSDGRWWVISPKTRKVDVSSRIYAAADITSMPTQ